MSYIWGSRVLFCHYGIWPHIPLSPRKHPIWCSHFLTSASCDGKMEHELPPVQKAPHGFSAFSADKQRLPGRQGMWFPAVPIVTAGLWPPGTFPFPHYPGLADHLNRLQIATRPAVRATSSKTVEAEAKHSLARSQEHTTIEEKAFFLWCALLDLFASRQHALQPSQPCCGHCPPTS